jgi:hypothetical protein
MDPAGREEPLVHAFRTWRMETVFEPGPPLFVHVGADDNQPLDQLAWSDADGTRTELAFDDGMSAFRGHRWSPAKGSTLIRGEFDGRQPLAQWSGTCPWYEFTTESLIEVEVADPVAGRPARLQWRHSGQTRILVDDDSGTPPCSVSWRERSGIAVSAGWAPEQEGKPTTLRIGDLTVPLALSFSGPARF